MDEELKMWMFTDEWEDSDLDIETSIPPLAKGDSAAPLALPVTLGDKITIHYGDDVPDDIRTRGTPEVWHYGGMAKDMVALLSEADHEFASEGAFYSPSDSRTLEGIYRFNERLLTHAEKVEIERVEVETL